MPESYEQGEFRKLLNDMLHRAHCPVVAIRHEDAANDCVFTDEHEAIRPLIRHLIEDHGLKRICFQKGFPGHGESEVRLGVFRDEMAAHGLSVSDMDICPGNMWTNCGEEAYRAFFSDPGHIPEAVICANDYMAVGLMRELKKHGLRVPEDVIVTGFDNIPMLGMDVPSLTTVQPDYSGMVVEAMNHLDRQIRGHCAQGQTKMALHGKFILGESCGCGKRHVDYFRRVSAHTTHLLELENDQDAMMNNMSIDLGACDDLKALHEVMISKRRGLMERFEPVWRDFAGKRVAFVCIDMDHLKQINDTFGHTAGDFAIRLVGRAIRETMPTGATGARIGGDEYVVFMPEGEKAGPFVAAFEEALQRLNDEEDRSFSVTASVGMAVKRLNGMDTIEKCIQEGDKQMYRVKEARHMNRIN